MRTQGKTALEFLLEQAKSHHFTCAVAYDGDYDLRPDMDNDNPPPHLPPSAADAIQIQTLLTSEGYKLYPLRDNSIHVHAPHRKVHGWFDRGWDCTYGLTVFGCEAFNNWNIHTPTEDIKEVRAQEP